ncbi:MAG: efflux RND transporter periplasmic adaptor subunit, partial [Ignavibacteriaceae bacterium]
MKKKNIIIIGLALIVIAAGLFFILSSKGDSNTASTEKQLYTCGMHPQIISDEPGNCPICEMKLVPIKNSAQKNKEKKIIHWRAPMDPNEIYDQPGKSKMGMDLVPVYENDESNSGIVNINPAVVQNMNVKIEEVKNRKLSAKIVTNGVLTTDETSEYIVTTKVNGWVEKLYVNYTGQKVNKGDKLMDIYSPELVAAQQEYLTAIAYNNSVINNELSNGINTGNDLLKNAERKLGLLDIPERDISKLKETNEVKTYVTLYSQKSGTVINKNVIEGQKIMAGSPLLQIA